MAGFDFQALNQKYMAQPANDAAGVGVSVVRTSKAMSRWACIGVAPLPTPSASSGTDRLLVVAIDENGASLDGEIVAWTRTMDAATETMETPAEIVINRWDTITCGMAGALDSDSVGNIRVAAGGGFAIIFQRQGALTPSVKPPMPVDPTPPPLTIEQRVTELESEVSDLKRIIGQWTGGK